MTLSRRDFIKGLGAFAVGLGLGALKAEAQGEQAVIVEDEIERTIHVGPSDFVEQWCNGFAEGVHEGLVKPTWPEEFHVEDAAFDGGECSTFDDVKASLDRFTAKALARDLRLVNGENGVECTLYDDTIPSYTNANVVAWTVTVVDDTMPEDYKSMLAVHWEASLTVRHAPLWYCGREVYICLDDGDQTIKGTGTVTAITDYGSSLWKVELYSTDVLTVEI